MQPPVFDGHEHVLDTDLAELERMLLDAGATEPLLDEAKSLSLGLFIRSLVGLDREAAMQAFSALLQGSKATPEHIEFIELIVNELTQNGVTKPRAVVRVAVHGCQCAGAIGGIHASTGNSDF